MARWTGLGGGVSSGISSPRMLPCLWHTRGAERLQPATETRALTMVSSAVLFVEGSSVALDVP